MPIRSWTLIWTWQGNWSTVSAMGKKIRCGTFIFRLRKGGFDLIVSSVYLQNHELPEGGLRAALEQIVVLKEQIRKNPEFLEIRSVEDLDRCLKDHRIGIILYMEGLDCIGSDVRLLTALWELGVRGASLTWSRRNLLASGCCKASECYEIRGGLSPEGFDVVREMERLGMFVDVSHLNDDGFENYSGNSNPAIYGNPFQQQRGGLSLS